MGSRGTLVAGVDEVGRGPLAGPVVAAAVILDPGAPIGGLHDSKALAPNRREAVAALVRAHALAWAVGRAEVEEIDRLNILQASLLAMRRAVLALSVSPARALVDGNRCPELPCRSEAITGGDATVAAISAASVLAKVARDGEMRALHRRYPRYGFDRNKGYPTREHLALLRMHGACSIHRRSFAPVRAVLARGDAALASTTREP
ncbi:MAG: ribonuclease HII [Gammaproteobacteria bacterium]|nr:ribonuclease HII [Gammaproteobacteria bacterium]NIR84163.1 ribonuclease HII [Gammaproteobacteria bacterium]NIR89475.1 ribonuclease HII [Gammaproteobacteria bacterium]NIU05318.1 ribonuclease HII [Gammaproteobacteria bacterium]NIV52258.1 ribonuclease HII [Gammaproteobacteria bacterium]